MTWRSSHAKSEALAARAQLASDARDQDQARALYADAAQHEQEALNLIPADKARTLGIVAVSAAALWYKAQRYGEAERLVLDALSKSALPGFARSELRTILQAIWVEDAKAEAGVKFLPGQVLVSIKGGDVVTGGAPLDLIVDKVKNIQSIFYRTVEHMRGAPLRRSGPPPAELQESCRPWLFQAPPGSYQFCVVVQEPSQKDLFKEHIAPDLLVERFLNIVDASSSENPERLDAIVAEPDYQLAFRRLARNLSPNGKSSREVSIRSAASSAKVLLDEGATTRIKAALRAKAPPPTDSEAERVQIKGTLRALHLDDDWLQVVAGSEVHKVEGLQDSIDDVIGPMVNRRVLVSASKTKNKLKLIDIELDE
jgi:hypothetical protein